MAVQETTNVAAIATRACSPGHQEDPLYRKAQEVKTSAVDVENELVATDKEQKRGGRKQELKDSFQVTPDGSMKLPTDKPEESHKQATEKIDTENTDDLSDIYISNEVLKQLRSQTDERKKKSVKQIRRKQIKSQRRAMNISGINNKEDTFRNIDGQPKKILKPSLRRKNNLSVGKSQFVEPGIPMEILSNSQENVCNKAENNNWMMDNDKTTHSSVVIEHFHSSSSSRNVAYIEDLIQPSASMCRLDSLKNNCKSTNLQSVEDTLDLVDKKELKRADSSGDSGCFSNMSVQSVSPSDGDRQEIIFEGCSPVTSLVTQLRVDSVNTQVSTSSSGLCSACGHEPQGNGSGLCKTCIGRIRHDGVRVGALGELRAYAQSIAESVKKILSISPRQSEAVLHPSTSLESGEEGKKRKSLAETKNGTNNTGAQLHKAKTQITMTHTDHVKAVNQLNKSVSFDGRPASQLDDTCRGSPVYWITNDKPTLPISSSTLSETDEGKFRGNLENASDHSVIDGDYFASSGKEIKPYGAHDDGDGSNIVERARRKSYTKQMSCLDRMRPEGDTRSIYSQLATSDRKITVDEHRRGFELHRGKSQICRTGNMMTEKMDKSFQKHEEEIKALNVFRLKVIHEGSPVDPLHTVQRGKGEDAKDRRALFMRSATAPNKNHMPKKDGSMEDKSSLASRTARTKRINTKLDMKANNCPLSQIKKLDLEAVQEKQQSIYEIELENWRDDTSVMAVTPFSRRRSTSYDGGRRTMSSKRNEKHRSVSRPAVDREDKGNKQRRHATSSDKSVTMNTNKDSGYKAKNERTLRFTNRFTDDNQTDVPIHSPTKTGTFTDAYRYDSLESSNIEYCYNLDTARIHGMSVEDKHLNNLESGESYFSDDKYYCHQKNNHFPAASQELTLNKQNARSLTTDNYYSHTDNGSHNISDHLHVGENALQFESENDNLSKFKMADDEDSYHKQVKMYDVNDVSNGKDNSWYSSQPAIRDVFGRDRSHESKSSTSFHIVTTARSSHSDVAVMKHQNSWEHGPSRRQQIYSETDVDTGLIYHFTKRQTTRAHVPAYNDLTSSCKDIYTMSGDVSTSASSNSANSTKSDVSDSAYTGGFFQHDPFYDNDSRVSSSVGSPDQVYFEPNSATKRESSELDIYTGALFSSSQNALSLGRVTEGAKNSALKDGSTNNSTRPPLSRVSRRLRHRPHIDVIKFKMAESTNELFTKCTQLNSELLVSNVSNNSSNWQVSNNLKDYVYEGASVSESKEPSYTEYKSSVKPAFHVKTLEKAGPVLNLMTYDNTPISNNSFFYTAPSQSSVVSDSIWYSGLSENIEDDTTLRQVALPEQAMVQASYSWQRNDDYYRSSQRPIINKTNNCSSCEDCEQTPCNTNNNRFEDIYTGFFEESNSKTCVPEQTNNCRKATSDNWYLEQPKRNYSSPDFYDEDSSVSEPLKRASGASYESTGGAYSSASVFGQASAAYSGSRTYMNQTGWCEYDKMDTSSSNNYVDESPKFRHPTSEPPGMSEKYSYFQYLSSQSPGESTYRYDKGAYGFDQRTPSPEADMNEIRKVGGIVCRENVVNREDYAEDVNRDLEQGAWMPFNFRHEEKTRHQEDTNTGRSEALSEILKVPVAVGNEKHSKHTDESSYNQDRIYDNVGARNKWREMTAKVPSVAKKREASPHKAFSAGDTKRQEHVRSGAWNPPDQIPDRARGKRPAPTTPKPTVLEGSKSSTTTSNVISSVTSIPSRLTSYVRRWF